MRLDTDWCCSDNDCNGFWFNAQHQEEDWLEAWRKVAKMSRPYKAVVGAGLKNEIRAMISGKSWGSGPFCPAEIFDRGNWACKTNLRIEYYPIEKIRQDQARSSGTKKKSQ